MISCCFQPLSRRWAGEGRRAAPGARAPRAWRMHSTTPSGSRVRSRLRKRRTVPPHSRRQAARARSRAACSGSAWTAPSVSATNFQEMQAKSRTQPHMGACRRDIAPSTARPRSRLQSCDSAGVWPRRSPRRNATSRSCLRPPPPAPAPAAGRRGARPCHRAGNPAMRAFLRRRRGASDVGAALAAGSLARSTIPQYLGRSCDVGDPVPRPHAPAPASTPPPP
jgi:hypothetical protein